MGVGMVVLKCFVDVDLDMDNFLRGFDIDGSEEL